MAQSKREADKIANKKEKGQGAVSPIVYESKRKIIKGLGLLFFLIGAFFILNSFFSITGNVAQSGQIAKDEVSILGLILEVIGVVLMVIKVK